MTVRRLLDEINSQELAEWMAFFLIENDSSDLQAKKKEEQDKKVKMKLEAAFKSWNVMQDRKNDKDKSRKNKQK